MDAEPLVIARLSPSALEKRLRARVPELQMLADCEVKIEMNQDSAHLGPDHWVQIARTIQDSWSRFDGVVVLHGTDTLAYTASALSMLLRPCRKPVILTGAQRPLAALRSDASRNLISAVEIAASGAKASSRVAHQVCVFFNETLFQGNRSRKRSAVDFAGFESPKAPVLARVGTSIQYFGNASSLVSGVKSSASVRIPRFESRFSRRVGMFHLTPAFPASALSHSLSELDGLLLVAFPSGTAPTHDPAFHALLGQAKKLELPVMVVTEGAGVTGSEYRAGKEMLEAGCLWSGAMTPECAYVKASYLLGQKNGREALKKWWSRELANEGVSQRF